VSAEGQDPVATARRIVAAIEREDIDEVRRLLAAGADPNVAIPMEGMQGPGLPVLFFACNRGATAMARALLEAGADPNDGESIYHAAEHGHADCLELLVAHGADPGRAHAYWHNTPLFFLLGYPERHPDIATVDRGIRWLLSHGADPEVTSGRLAETALHCAARTGRGGTMIELLLSHGANPSRPRADGATPHGLALRYGNAETVAALARAGVDPAAATPLDRLLAAAHAGDARGARAILAADPAALLGDSALGAIQEQVARAAAHGTPAALETMLALGFPADDAGNDGGTPLHWAAWHGRAQNVALLLAHRVRIDVRDGTYGCSALAWACHGSANCRQDDAGYIQVVDQLVAAGARREFAVNRWGTTEVAMASEKVAEHLRARGFA